MTTKDDFNQRRRVSRSNSLLGDSFKMGASLLGLGGSSRQIKHLTLDNVNIVDKSKFQNGQKCSVCFVPFNKMNRVHHCRYCGRSTCGDCSGSTINKQRVCDVCLYKYQQPQKMIMKQAYLQRLKMNALQYLGGRLYLDEQYKNLELQLPNAQQLQQQRNSTKQRISKLQEQIQQKKRIREQLQRKLLQLKGQ